MALGRYGKALGPTELVGEMAEEAEILGVIYRGLETTNRAVVRSQRKKAAS